MADDTIGPDGGASGEAPPPQMPPPMPPPPPPSYPPPGSPPMGGQPAYTTTMPPPPAWNQPVGPVSTTGFSYAGWWQRVGGTLIDGVILAVVNGILNAVFRHNDALRVHWSMTNNTTGTVTYYSISLLVIVFGSAIAFLYAWIQLGTSGRTIGMRAVGIRAVRAEDDRPLGMGIAAGRTIVQIVLGWTIIGILLSDLWPLWDPRNQTLQDKAAGTVVIKSRAG